MRSRLAGLTLLWRCSAALALGLVAATIPAVNSAWAQVNAYNSIGLQWTATGDDGTTGTANWYDLRYSSTPIGADTLTWWNSTASRASGLPTPRPAGATDSTRVTGLTPGTTYYFLLKAVDEAGNPSPYSNVASATTAACAAPTVAPQGFDVAEQAGDALLQWSGVPEPVATLLHVYRGTGASGALTLLTTLAPDATGYTDGSVSPGTTYRYRVAWGSACADGPSSSTVSLTLPGTPPPPTPTAEPAASVHAFPNPSHSADPFQFKVFVPGTSSQQVSLKLYDMNGRLIATMAEGSYAAGSHTLNWSRRSTQGAAVAPGYYELIGTVGIASVRDRILLLP